MVRKIALFRGAAAFSSWLYRITANTAYQKLRTRRRRREAPTEVPPVDRAPPGDQRIGGEIRMHRSRLVLRTRLAEHRSLAG